MPLSIFVLALWIFLQSYVQLGWGAVDAKLIGLVGLVFVICVVLEAWFVAYRGRPFLPFHAMRRHE